MRGIHDFRVNKILDSTLQVLALSTENEEPNVILEQILQLTSETEEVCIYHFAPNNSWSSVRDFEKGFFIIGCIDIPTIGVHFTRLLEFSIGSLLKFYYKKACRCTQGIKICHFI